MHFHVKTGNDKTGNVNRGGFKAESFLGHITRRLPTLPFSSLFSPRPLPSFLRSLRSRPLKSNYTVCGSAVSSVSRVWGGASDEFEIWCILAIKSDIWWQQL